LTEPIKLQIAASTFSRIAPFRKCAVFFVDNLGDKVVICWVVKETAYFGHGSPVDRATGEYMVREMNSEHPEMYHWLEPANKLPFACNGSPLP